jgi:sulfonate transport system substrate-binding protein
MFKQVIWALTALVAPTLAPAAGAAEQPAVIRFGISTAGVGNPPKVSGGWLAVAQQGQYLEKEFAADGIKIQWVFFKGQGPAVNEAISNNQLDFTSLGDLPSIIGRSVGLDTRLVLVNGRGSRSYVAVQPNSTIQRIEDLRGKRVAFNKGTASQLLVQHGMSENDLKVVNMEPASYRAAFLAGNVDAIFGSFDVLGLQHKGQAKVIYSSKADPAVASAAHVLVNQKFATHYPQLTQRVVKALVKAAYWTAQPQNSDAVFKLWTQTGYQTEAVYREEYSGVPLAQRLSPLFDGYTLARDKQAVQDAYRLKLIRKPFDVDQWVDQRYLNAALKELKLEGYWPRLDDGGRLVAAR